MKNIIIFFLILFSSELFSQSWELMYKEDFLYFDSTTQSSGIFYCDDLIIKNDSIVISRMSYSDTLFLIYEVNKKKWSYIERNEIWSRFKNDSIFDLYQKFHGLTHRIFDSNNNIWCSTSNNNILNIQDDTIIIYDKIITPDSNLHYISSIMDIKFDKKNNLWAMLAHKDSTTFEIKVNICKLKGNYFESISCLKHNYNKDTRLRQIMFDNENRLWFTIADTVYMMENNEIKKRYSSYEFPNGYGYFTQMVIDSKNVVYLLNHNCEFFIINNDSIYMSSYIWEKERYDFPNAPLFYYWMCIDSTDNVWITGLHTCNLYKFDSEKNWTIYDVPRFETAADEWCYKFKIEADKNGKIWMPAQSRGIYGYGLYIFDPNPVSVEEEKNKVEANGLPDVWVYNLFPNPAENTVTLDFFLHRNEVDNLELSLYNVMGMKIKDIKEHYDYDKFYMRATVNFSVAGLPKGGYIVTLKAGNSKIARLLLVGF